MVEEEEEQEEEEDREEEEEEEEGGGGNDSTSVECGVLKQAARALLSASIMRSRSMRSHSRSASAVGASPSLGDSHHSTFRLEVSTFCQLHSSSFQLDMSSSWVISVIKKFPKP